MTRAAAVAAAIVLCLVALGCSGDDDPGSVGPTSSTTAPTGSIVPGGSTPSGGSGAGTPTESSSPNGTGDPSAGIPLDQFCRGFREVRKAETSMAAAVDGDDVATFKTAFADLTVAYQAMAENPPDQVADALPAVFFLYEDVSAQVVQATSIDALKASALQLQADDRAEDLESVRDYGSANC